ncbi:MAG: AraC family transcriptional regulator [Lentisphaerae bacterium]|nr:AraC family transcriptional regulator [Lentisphaerota bacterium]
MRIPHRHRELEVNLVTRGDASYVVDGARYTLGPGTIIWLFPEQRHVLVGCSPEFSMWIGVFRPRFVGRHCRTHASVLTQSTPGRVLIGELAPSSLHHLDLFFADLEKRQSEPALINAGLGYALLRAWAAYAEAEQDQKAQRLHPAVARMIALLDASPLDEPLQQLSRRAGLSHSRLSRLFKHQLGQSLPEFRDRIRIERFCDAYRADPDRTMLDIALDAGFGSYAQFYRVFKRQMGEGPASYRRRRGRKN